MQTQFAQYRSDLRILNDQIRYTGQYYANKEVYSQFSNAKYIGKYRKEHAKEIQKYEEARNWLRSFYQDGKMTTLPCSPWRTSPPNDPSESPDAVYISNPCILKLFPVFSQ